MIVFENSGEIDPQLISLIGVNIKETDNAIGFFGTGLKYAVACLARWGETMIVQSGLAEFTFSKETQSIRGKNFDVLSMRSKVDCLRLGFTTELGKNWEPWMAYRELWCNAHDEPDSKVYEVSGVPIAKPGITRVVVAGSKIEQAHASRDDFILQGHHPVQVVDGLEIYQGSSSRVFYRGIAVRTLDKPSLYTYNITKNISLTEDRTASSWDTNIVIARGLAALKDERMIDETILAHQNNMESQLDYDYVYDLGETWKERAIAASTSNPLAVHPTIRNKFAVSDVKTCPTCGRKVD